MQSMTIYCHSPQQSSNPVFQFKYPLTKTLHAKWLLSASEIEYFTVLGHWIDSNLETLKVQHRMWSRCTKINRQFACHRLEINFLTSPGHWLRHFFLGIIVRCLSGNSWWICVNVTKSGPRRYSYFCVRDRIGKFLASRGWLWCWPLNGGEYLHN